MMYCKTIKYAVHPGYIHSISDSGMHYISAQQLMRLYNVNPQECIIVDSKRPENTRGYKDMDKLIPLFPRGDGKYNLLKTQKRRER